MTCSLPWNQDFCSTSFNNLHLFFPFAARFQLGWHSLHPVYPLINQYGSRVNSLKRLELTVVFIFLYLFVTFSLYIYINRHDDRFCDKEITFKSIQDLKNTFQTPNMYDFGFVLLWEMWKVLSSVYCLPQKQNKKLHFWRRSFDLFRQDFFNCITIIVLSLLKWTLIDTNLIKRLKTYTLFTPSLLFLHTSV